MFLSLAFDGFTEQELQFPSVGLFHQSPETCLEVSRPCICGSHLFNFPVAVSEWVKIHT